MGLRVGRCEETSDFQIPIYDGEISFTDGAHEAGNLAGSTLPNRLPALTSPQTGRS